MAKKITRKFTITITGRESDKKQVPINIKAESLKNKVEEDLQNWLNQSYGSVFGIPTFGYNDFVSVNCEEVTE